MRELKSEKSKVEPRPCPVCGKNDMVIRIIYGLPSDSLFEEASKGKVELGGCIERPDNPSWYCKRDETKF